MKSVNFIDGASPHNSRSFSRWLVISFSLGTLLLLTLSGIYIHSWQTYRGVHQELSKCTYEQEQYMAVVDEQKKLQDEAHSLKEKIVAMQECKEDGLCACRQCEGLNGICKDELRLDSYKYDNSRVEMVVRAASIEQVAQCMCDLEKNGKFPKLTIVSMKPDADHYMFTIKG